jgi:hypothetical protein
MTDDLKGGCACGAVRYQLALAPTFVHYYHCRDCQRQTGSASKRAQATLGITQNPTIQPILTHG